MSNTSPQAQWNEHQPGLEVQHHPYVADPPGLEVAPVQSAPYSSPPPTHLYDEKAAGLYVDGPEVLQQPSRKWYRRKRFLVIGAIAAVVIIAVAVGVPLGISKSHQTSSSPQE